MSEESCVRIEIIKTVPFFGGGDSLENRLRNVRLKGFPEVKIYGNAHFECLFLMPEEIMNSLHTPQPAIYQPHLNRIGSLAELFAKKGIDIMNLENAYDFSAWSESGAETQWTMLPPIVETFSIPRHGDGTFNYSPLIGDELSQALAQNNLGINPEAAMMHTKCSGKYSLINDGSHRIHYGFQNHGIKVIRVSGMTPGFPYYAVPQPYSSVNVRDKRDDTAIETKIHVVDSPGHKLLYRLFPSGGIMSGQVRPDKKLA